MGRATGRDSTPSRPSLGAFLILGEEFDPVIIPKADHPIVPTTPKPRNQYNAVRPIAFDFYHSFLSRSMPDYNSSIAWLSLQLPCASHIARPLGVGDFVVGRLSEFNTPKIALRSLTLANSYPVLVMQLFRTYSYYRRPH